MEFGTMMGLLLSGLQFTAIIFVITLVGALPLGVLVALGRMSKFKPLSLLVQFYISVMRGTPLMLQLMMWMKECSTGGDNTGGCISSVFWRKGR